jgi:MoxR-like ATPase
MIQDLIEVNGSDIYSIQRLKNAVGVVTKRPAHKSILIRGGHGLGKSSVVKEIAQESAVRYGLQFVKFEDVSRASIIKLVNPDHVPNEREKVGIDFDPQKHYVMIDLRVAQRDHVDFVGALDKSTGITQFIATDFITLFSAKDAKGMIFLDEIDQGTAAVQKAIFQLVHDREINSMKISDHVSIFAAGNSGIGSSVYGLKSMSAALIDRFWVATLFPTSQEWINWAKTHQRLSFDLIANFFEDDSRKIYLDYPTDNKSSDAVLQSRRSWANFASDFDEIIEMSGMRDKIRYFADQDYYQIPPGFNIDLVKDVALGYLGTNATFKFVEFLKNSLPSITVDDIMQGKWNPDDMPKEADIVYCMESIFSNVSKFTQFVGNDANGHPQYQVIEEFNNVAKFIEDYYEYSHVIQEIVFSILFSKMHETPKEIIGDRNAQSHYVAMHQAFMAKGGIEYGRIVDEDGPLMHIIATKYEKPEFRNDILGSEYMPRFSDEAKKKRMAKIQHERENRENLNLYQKGERMNLNVMDDTKMTPEEYAYTFGDVPKEIPQENEQPAE